MSKARQLMVICAAHGAWVWADCPSCLGIADPVLSDMLQRIDAARESIAAMERNPLAGDEHAIKLMRQDSAAKLRALADEIERGE